MRLTYNDRKEIDAIIAKFTEEDNERISAEVERDIKQMKSSPLTPVLRDICSDHVAFELASDETDWQVAVDEFMWDRLTDYYKFQHALAVFMARHQTREAA